MAYFSSKAMLINLSALTGDVVVVALSDCAC
jgi:hypothetical protein